MEFWFHGTENLSKRTHQKWKSSGLGYAESNGINPNAFAYVASVGGAGVVPRNFIATVEGEVLVEAITPDPMGKLLEGLYLGILDFCNVKERKIEKQGNETYRITWKR